MVFFIMGAPLNGVTLRVLLTGWRRRRPGDRELPPVRRPHRPVPAKGAAARSPEPELLRALEPLGGARVFFIMRAPLNGVFYNARTIKWCFYNPRTINLASGHSRTLTPRSRIAIPAGLTLPAPILPPSRRLLF